jgi:hypothetical protein
MLRKRSSGEEHWQTEVGFVIKLAEQQLQGMLVMIEF